MNFLQPILILLFLAGVISGQDNERPNVLMIVVDDMNDCVGCLAGHPDTRTPNIDRLAQRGTLFSNAHCAAPVCNPSRVSTLTGLRPSTTGIYDNSVKWPQQLANIESLPRHFKRNGYQVFGGGKVYHHMPGFNRSSDWHFYFKQRFDGHYQSQLHAGKDTTNFHFPSGFPLNQLDAVRDLERPPRNPREFDWGPLDKAIQETGDGQMIEWAVESLKSNQPTPFLMIAGIYRPHLPFYAPSQFFQSFDASSIKLPDILRDDLTDLPPAGQAMASQRREDLALVKSEGKFRELMHAYLASIAFADALIGRLLDGLDSGPSADNTIVVLWSDHGWHFGEKQHLHKMTLWERATRVPFIISLPEAQKNQSKCNAPVGLVDIFPTLNALCGLPPLPALDGQDLTPLLSQPTANWSYPAITTHGYNNHAIRSTNWRYIRYANGDEELYDHRKDPHEWYNIASLPEHVRTKEQLRGFLPVRNTSPLAKKRKP